MPTIASRRTVLRLAPLASALGALLSAPLAHADSFTASDYPGLVQAIDAANAADSRAAPHTITLTGDIEVAGPMPLILCNATIDGQGHTLNGADQYRLLFVGVDEDTRASLATEFPDSALGARLAVTIENLTLAHGNAMGGGGSGEGGGGMGAGGGLFVGGAADVTLQDVAFESNAAFGGNGGDGEVGGGGGLGGFGGGGGGGGIYGSGGVSGGGVFGDGANAWEGTNEPGGPGGGGYSGRGGDSNNNPPQAGTLAIFGLSGGGGNGAGDGTATGDPGAPDGGGGGGGTNEGGGGGGGFGGQSGTVCDPVSGTPGIGGAGGFGGGGGSAGTFGSNGGRGGFGGGGGYGGNDPESASGGFGGGGGFTGNGGFGGGGGGWGGHGGFGGGGGNQNGPGGFGGGQGGGPAAISSGGGGAGMGGAVFVVDGGTLTIAGNGTIGGSSVTAGDPGGFAGGGNPTGGSAYGAGMFLQGTNGTLVFAPGRSATFTINDGIADEAGSNGAASTNARGLTVSGDGTVVVAGDETYSGATTVSGAVLEIDGTLEHSTAAVAGGTLQGTGTVAALDAQSGTVAPGTAADPFGAMHVAGDASFGGGATLSLKADATATSSAMLAIVGAATLSGTVAVDFGDATPTIGSAYTLLTAASIDGSFALGLPAGVFGQLVYATDSVTLEITDSPPDEIFANGFDGGAEVLRDGGIRR